MLGADRYGYTLGRGGEEKVIRFYHHRSCLECSPQSPSTSRSLPIRPVRNYARFPLEFAPTCAYRPPAIRCAVRTLVPIWSEHRVAVPKADASLAVGMGEDRTSPILRPGAPEGRVGSPRCKCRQSCRR